MARVEPATLAMFDDIYPLLVRLNAGLGQEKWRLQIDYHWRAAGDELGYVLIEQGAIVGFLGTLFSRRTIGGREVRLCNTTNWVVQEQFRGESLRLLMTVLKQRDVTFTNLTSNPDVGRMMKPLGFKLLDTRVRMLFPMPVLPRWADRNPPTIGSDHEVLVGTLDAADGKIFSDHAGCDCRHVVVRELEGYCYLVFTKRHRRAYGREIAYCHIHYISNRRVFLRQLGRIKRYFLKTFGAWFIAVDERLLGPGSGAFSKAYRLTVPRYYRSNVLAPDQIDNLYTELVVLGL